MRSCFIYFVELICYNVGHGRSQVVVTLLADDASVQFCIYWCFLMCDKKVLGHFLSLSNAHRSGLEKRTLFRIIFIWICISFVLSGCSKLFVTDKF